MKIRRFLLGLGAAAMLAFTLSSCDSGGSSAAQSNADVAAVTNGQAARQGIFEWFVVAVRGFNQDAADVGGNVCPPGASCFIPQDVISAIQFFELQGVNNTPSPNANISAPNSNGASQTPLSPASPNGTANGIHDVAFSPQGDIVAWVNRGRYPSNTVSVAHTLGKTGVVIQGAVAPQLPIFDVQAPLDNITGVVVESRPGEATGQANTALLDIQDVSVVWAPDGRHVIFSQYDVGGVLNPAPANFGAVYVMAYNAANQSFTQVQALAMPRIFSDMVFNGNVLYALSRFDNQIFIFDRDPGTGLLTQRGAPVNTVTGVRLGAVDRNGQFLFVIGHESGDIEGFTINADGSLTSNFVNTTAITGLGGGIAINPSTNLLAFSDFVGGVFTANINANGTIAILPNPPGSPLVPTDTNGTQFRNSGYLKFNPSGTFLIVSFQADGAGATIAAGNVGNLGKRLAQIFGNVFEGGIAVYRIQSSGLVQNSHQQVQVTNPFAIDFIQRAF